MAAGRPAGHLRWHVRRHRRLDRGPGRAGHPGRRHRHRRPPPRGRPPAARRGPRRPGGRAADGERGRRADHGPARGGRAPGRRLREPGPDPPRGRARTRAGSGTGSPGGTTSSRSCGSTRRRSGRRWPASRTGWTSRRWTARSGSSTARPSARYPRKGLVVDRAAAADVVRRAFLHPDRTQDGVVVLPTRADDPAVTKDAVSRAMDGFANPALSGPVVVRLDGEGVQLQPDDFAGALSMTAVDGTLEPRLDGARLMAVLRPRLKAITDAPRDARIEVVRGRPRIVPARDGVSVDPQEVTDGFLQVLTADGAARTLSVRSVPAKPDVSTADVRRLGITERVSGFTTHFPYAAYRNINLGRAAQLVDGTVLKPGETFSLNKVVGERTAANGFTEGLHHRRRRLHPGPRRRGQPGRHHHVQRGVLRRPRGRRAQGALVLHQPLPGRPGGDGGVARRRPALPRHHAVRRAGEGLGRPGDPHAPGHHAGDDVLHEVLGHQGREVRPLRRHRHPGSGTSAAPGASRTAATTASTSTCSGCSTGTAATPSTTASGCTPATRPPTR